MSFYEYWTGRSKNTHMFNSLNRIGMHPTGRFIEGRITHYLKFSVKITTHLLWSKPYSDYQFFLHNKISDLREKGLGYRRISDILNEEGILTVRGKVFTNSHVHSILQKKNIREERLNRELKKEVSKFKLDCV
jgi:hypothetical protein